MVRCLVSYKEVVRLIFFILFLDPFHDSGIGAAVFNLMFQKMPSRGEKRLLLYLEDVHVIISQL